MIADLAVISPVTRHLSMWATQNLPADRRRYPGTLHRINAENGKSKTSGFTNAQDADLHGLDFIFCACFTRCIVQHRLPLKTNHFAPTNTSRHYTPASSSVAAKGPRDEKEAKEELCPFLSLEAAAPSDHKS